MSKSRVVRLEKGTYDAIALHGESSYPNEGAGFLLGTSKNDLTQVEDVLVIKNKWDEVAQGRRYLLEPDDWMRAESEAESRTLNVVGIFHSHPDHPPRPSQFDIDAAWPNLSYLITSVRKGKAVETLSWRLDAERTEFLSEELKIGD